MVQVGRIHKRIDRCVPGGRQDIARKRTEVSDRVLPESGPEVSDRILPESGPGCPTGYCRKADRRCPTGVPPGKSSHFGRNHPRREPKTGYVFFKPPCLKVNENLPGTGPGSYFAYFRRNENRFYRKSLFRFSQRVSRVNLRTFCWRSSYFMNKKKQPTGEYFL